MPWNNDAVTNALRLAYNAAVAAHADRSRALTEALMQGAQPTPELVEAEAKARVHLNAARKKLHSAMALAIRGSDSTS
jgi:hypothetical protein